MPRPKKGPRFGNSAAAERAMLANIASSLFWEGKVVTTLPRAKAVRPLAEKLITRARRGDLHARRIVLKTITDIEVVTRLFDEVAPRYAERPGGYTRITRLGPRRGDAAEQALIELV
jgi:large subunit ribosomal protein L17